MLIQLWRYRNFILSSVRRDLQGRFARSALGAFWFILHPLAQAFIFSIVLAEVMHARLPNVDSPVAYPIYLLAGMAAWNLFSEITNRSLSIFLERSSAIKKIAFPKICLPAIVWGSAMVNHILLLVAILFVCICLGHMPAISVLALPIGIITISLFAFGIGLTCGLFNIFVRDVAQVLTVVIQIWFWMTPIVYTPSVIPSRLHWLVELNPMTGMVRIYQDAILYGTFPSLVIVFSAVLSSAISAGIALVVFRRASGEIADAL